MPFPMKIQPLDPEWAPPGGGLATLAKPPAAKSRLKRLFERQFPGVLRIGGAAETKEKDREAAEVEPSSVCLAKMVQNFLEDGNSNGSDNYRHTRSRCNCFNGNRDESSDDELDIFSISDAPAAQSHGEASVILKSLVLCTSASERDILAEVNRIVEKSKIKAKDAAAKRAMVDGLIAIGYDAGVCKSTWEKTASVPSGEYEYVDVIVGGESGDGERVIVDVDFRSEFEIARPNKAYRAVVQSLPVVFVGKAERLQQVVALAAEATRQSMRKKGLHMPPWRKYEYMKSKWLSPHTRRLYEGNCDDGDRGDGDGNSDDDAAAATRELDQRSVEGSGESPVVIPAKWEPPAVEPKAPTPRGAKVVAGLAAIF